MRQPPRLVPRALRQRKIRIRQPASIIRNSQVGEHNPRDIGGRIRREKVLIESPEQRHR
jgi:hypothetical protein